jgi:hypothetical protein
MSGEKLVIWRLVNGSVLGPGGWSLSTPPPRKQLEQGWEVEEVEVVPSQGLRQ